MKTFDDGQIHCICTAFKGLKSITYIIAPAEISKESLQRWVHATSSNIVVIYGMDWDNDLTPWPAAGVAPGTPAFKGNARQFVEHLEKELMPAVEKALGCPENPRRNLVGISLSGLFALWAWAQSDMFADVCCISASLWYEGFVDWMQAADLSGDRGSVLFILGDKESESRNMLFSTVEAATGQVIAILKGAGVDARLQMVAGDHRSDMKPRLDLAMDFLAERNQM